MISLFSFVEHPYLQMSIRIKSKIRNNYKSYIKRESKHTSVLTKAFK